MATPKYNPDDWYVVCDGQRISLPDGKGHKRFIAYNKDVDKAGHKIPFQMSHRTPPEVAYLVEVKRVIEPAPATPLAPPASGGKKEQTGGKTP